MESQQLDLADISFIYSTHKTTYWRKFKLMLKSYSLKFILFNKDSINVAFLSIITLKEFISKNCSYFFGHPVFTRVL